MNLLIMLDPGRESEELLVSARALSHVSGWPVRGLHVRADDAAPDLALPARLTTNTVVEEAHGDPVAAVLAAARAPQTLFVVRPGMRPISTLRRIVVPLDGSPSSSEAMRVTDEAFCGRGREIVVVHVGTADMPDEPGSLPAPRMVDQEHYEWSSWHDEFTMRFATCPEGGRHRTVVGVGDPPEVIVKEATTPPADLIVLAWAGVFAAGHSLFVRRLLEEAPCPLLLVPVPAHP
jgi:nucleotide-binding universal stress UspA family protein